MWSHSSEAALQQFVMEMESCFVLVPISRRSIAAMQPLNSSMCIVNWRVIRSSRATVFSCPFLLKNRCSCITTGKATDRFESGANLHAFGFDEGVRAHNSTLSA